MISVPETLNHSNLRGRERFEVFFLLQNPFASQMIQLIIPALPDPLIQQQPDNRYSSPTPPGVLVHPIQRVRFPVDCFHQKRTSRFLNVVLLEKCSATFHRVQCQKKAVDSSDQEEGGG